jgi:hypothetical protein
MRLLGELDANRCMSHSDISEDVHQIATRIAQKLRDAGFSCEIVTFEPADTGVRTTTPLGPSGSRHTIRALTKPEH